MAEIVSLDQARRRRFMSGPAAKRYATDAEAYAAAVASQKANDDRRWVPDPFDDNPEPPRAA